MNKPRSLFKEYDMRNYQDKHKNLKVEAILKEYADRFGEAPYPILVNPVDLESTKKAGLDVTQAVRWVRPNYVFFGIKEKIDD